MTRLVCVRPGHHQRKNAKQTRHGLCDAFVRCDQINENINSKKQRVTHTVTRSVCVGRPGTINAKTQNKRVTDHVTRLFVVNKISENSNSTKKRVTQTVTGLVCVGHSGASDVQTRIKRVMDHVTCLFFVNTLLRTVAAK